jgi:hypothetical protein
MHLILFLVGAVVAFAGVVLLRFAVPVADVAAAALFASAVVMLVGGLIIVALAAAVRMLKRIAERLEIQPLPLPPVAAVGRDDPAPRPVRTTPLAPAAGAARPSLLGWLGRASAPAGQASVTPPAVPEPAELPVDLAPLTRVPEEPRAAPAPPKVVAPPAPPPAPPRVAPRPAAPAANGTPETTVYKSGVIDGMAYTLFMDGSIEAELPSGRVRFATVDELQKYLAERR